MNYYGAKELAESFRTVRKNTIIIAEDIPDNKYSFRPAPESRSIAETLIHIAVSTGVGHKIHAVERRTTLVGLDFESVMRDLHAEEKKTRTKAQIIELLRTNGESWARWLEGLREDFLAERVTMPDGESKSRFEMLLSTKEHEMHHRGQLMQTERMLGIVPHLTRQREAHRAQASPAKAKS